MAKRLRIRRRPGDRRIGLQRAPRPSDLARELEIALLQRVAQALEALAVGTEADHDELRARHLLEHQRPGGEQQVDPLADDQLADERDESVLARVQSRERLARRALVKRES